MHILGFTPMGYSRRRSLRLEPGSPELLEGRLLLSTLPAAPHSRANHATAHHVGSLSPVVTTGHASRGQLGHGHPLLHRVHAASAAHPFAGGGPPGSALTPAQTRHIYSIDRISNLGAGQTIAIVDAYDDPNIYGDTDVFDRQFMTTLGGTTSYYAAYGASS